MIEFYHKKYFFASPMKCLFVEVNSWLLLEFEKKLRRFFGNLGVAVTGCKVIGGDAVVAFTFPIFGACFLLA
jgi:hypothetical protein